MVNDSVVHLIDDDEAVRHAVSFMLRTHGLVVQSYPSATAFLDALPAVGHGWIVTDIRMPHMDGLELQRVLKGRGITLPVIVITAHGDVALAVAAMKAGAVDFVEKPFDDETLITAIRQSAPPRDQATRDEARLALQARTAALTPRERAVLLRLIDGQTNKTIGNALSISARTVEVHRAHVMAKMGAASLSELIRLSIAAGLVPNA